VKKTKYMEFCRLSLSCPEYWAEQTEFVCCVVGGDLHMTVFWSWMS